MTKIHVDLRFAELEYELWGLDKYRTLLEDQIAFLQEQETIRTRAELKSKGYEPGDGDYELSMQELYDLIKGIIPRFYRGPFLVALWGIFESGIDEISRYIAEEKKCALRLRDIAGRDLKEKLSKYFNHVLKYDLGIESKTWNKLEEIKILRNVIAHSNGRISLSGDLKSKVERWARDKRGIDIYYDFLILSDKYIQFASSTIIDILTGLISRTKKDFE
jgi:hypothetical protein